jgi:hypothetical protein
MPKIQFMLCGTIFEVEVRREVAGLVVKGCRYGQ